MQESMSRHEITIKVTLPNSQIGLDDMSKLYKALAEIASGGQVHHETKFIRVGPSAMMAAEATKIAEKWLNDNPNHVAAEKAYNKTLAINPDTEQEKTLGFLIETVFHLICHLRYRP